MPILKQTRLTSALALALAMLIVISLGYSVPGETGSATPVKAKNWNLFNQSISQNTIKGKIAFSSSRDVIPFNFTHTEIYIMDPDGSNPTRVTHSTTENLKPSLSPDGTRVAFVTSRIDGSGSHEIHVINIDGTGEATLTPSTANDESVAWSPDGTKLAFTSVIFLRQIYVMNTDGSSRRNLSNSPEWDDENPAWSRDGKKLAFERSFADLGPYIYMMNADGSEQTKITDGGDKPSWSPDGTKIAFSCGAQICVMNADGTNPTNLTNNTSENFDPTWSPDGTKIAYDSTPLNSNGCYCDPYHIYVMNADGSNQTNITDQKYGDRYPDWQPLSVMPANPIDDPQFFVTQHYHDFLNRDPDPAGLNFWVNQITSCNGDPTCIDIKRQNVSAAYFLSREFQETGFFVIKVQRVAFGHISQDATKRISRQQFVTDSAQVGNGFIDGQPNADTILDQNKTAYAQSVITSANFVSQYPSTLSASAYVDALFTTGGVTPTSTERQDAITAFGSGDTAGRAAALRKVAETDSVKNAEFDPAFVLLQYFGYLRRNPTDPPDNNDNGYQFWLGKLTQFNGDYIGSQMVRSFIVSTEYRQRFGRP